jgi:hypothetical protein
LLSVVGCLGDLLYRTDFENFTVGDNKWHGTDGWIASNTVSGVQGIDQDIIPGGGLGKTAFIGFRQPVTRLTYVAKPVNYTPGENGLPLVRVETLIGIQDSVDKTARDSFFVSVWNGTGGYLAGIRFDNRPASYGIWRADGANPDHDTGMVFFRGELHLLVFTVNLANNTWSAFLDLEPLFVDAPFTANASVVDFGYLAYEWEIGTASPGGYGDNWMLVADTVIRSAPLGVDPFRLESFSCGGNTTDLSWLAQKGFDYQVEYSEDLKSWRADLPDSSFPAISTDHAIGFQDCSPGAGRRFYRVLREESP